MIYFIVNPLAGGGKGTEVKSLIEEELSHYSGNYEIHLTEYASHAVKLAQELSGREGCRGIVAVGGDGTFSEVLNGMDTLVPLGLIPCGTGNDFAKGANLTSDIKKCLDAIFSGRTSSIDYIRVGNKRCLNIVGTGFDVDILAREARYRKKWKSKLTYYAALFVTILFIKFRKIHLVIDGTTEVDRDMLIFVAANGKYFGGGMPMVPSAVVNDGFIDVLLVHKVHWYIIPKLLISFLKGNIEKQTKYISRFHCKKIECSLDGYNMVEMDGEVSPSLPAAIEICSNELKLFSTEEQ